MPGARQLLADGRPVRLGGRAFDLLLVLLRARGSLVSKEEILSSVWPSTVVEETNLRFQMAELRRALGNDRDIIKTVTGRGYLLATELAREPDETALIRAHAPDSAPSPDGTSDGSVLQDRSSDRGSPPQSETEPTIAVIDDDPSVRTALRGLFRSAGIKAVLFASVSEFLEHVPERPFQCLVLDVWLPGRNGLDFQTDLAKANPGLPVIFISGHADVPMSVRAMKAGAVDFLTKPVHHVDLLNAIRRAIGIASQTQS